MQFKSLEIQGFKSFPDRIRLEFDEGITAVVGPNGSGKSNLVDAVRWVFGEQSSKTLRGVRMEDVIFGGTQTRKPLGSASVTLTIDNRDRELDYDADEISLTRRLYRTGESEYRINNTAVRLKDMTELFMDTGLGRDGYSIIGQGKIAEIVSSKSQERREIFEEAAGISKFRYRKSEAERRLSMAQENLLRLMDILTELEDRLGPLEQDAAKAKEFLEYAQEKRVLEVSVWLESLAKFQEQMRTEQDRYIVVKEEHEQLSEQESELESEIEQFYSAMQRCVVEMDELRLKLTEQQEQSAKNEAAIAVGENDMRHNAQTIDELREQLRDFERSREELAVRAGQLREALAQNSEQLALATQEQQQLSGDAASHTEQEAQLAGSAEGIKARRAELFIKIEQAKVATASAGSLLEESTGRLEILLAGSSSKLMQEQALVEELEICEGLIAQIAQTTEELTNAKSGFVLKLASRRERHTALAAEREAHLAEAGQREQRAKLLEDMERSFEGYNQSVRFVMAQTERGMLRGVFGPVSRLIKTNDETATAIEVALGASMQNIVVDSEQTAKQAIGLLAQQNQGRATFLPLTSVKGNTLQERGLPMCEGFVGLACDLVEYEPRFVGVIKHLLGRIAVATDLDRAVEIAKRYNYAFRIVTLDGQVVNTGGSMTGGSAVRSAGVLGRQGQIERLRAEAAQKTEQAAALAPQITELERDIGALEAEVWGIDAELKNAGEDAIRAESEQRRLKHACADAATLREQAEREQTALASRIEELRKKNADEDELLAALETELAQAETSLDEIAAQRAQLAQQLGEFTARRSENDMRLLALGKDGEVMADQLAQVEAQLAGEQVRREQIAGREAELSGQNAQLEQETAALRAHNTELATLQAQATERTAALAAERDECEQRATHARAASREQSARREGVARELARLEERRGTMQAEYDGIIARLWDEYELTRSQAEQIAVPLESPAKSQRRLGELRSKIKALGNVNVGAIEQYAEVSERHTFLKGQMDDAERSRVELLRLISELTKQMEEMFLTSFAKINSNFSEIFAELFGGGRAHLSLTDEGDALESGIDIFVQPPGKIIKNLATLSGGEQTFVAIAIYFAILKVNPAPFCLLDEIEAALDDVNVVKYAQYLRKMTDKTQFISITHRRGTMEEADVLYGVTMQEEGVSKLLELRVGEVEERLGIGTGVIK